MTLTSVSMKKLKSQRGFSLIEILMVLILIAVLAAIAINAFVNFRAEAVTASIQANLKVLRTGIAVQYSQMQMRCGSPAGIFPPLINLNNNNITFGLTPCNLAQVPIESERAFVQGSIPIPLQNVTNLVIDCFAGGDCVRDAAGPGPACDGTATYTDQWCYNSDTGEIWMDSADPVRESY